MTPYIYRDRSPDNIQLNMLTYCQTVYIAGKRSRIHMGSGVGQSVNRAAKPPEGHTLTEFFGQVSQRLGSATSNYLQTSTNTIPQGVVVRDPQG